MKYSDKFDSNKAYQEFIKRALKASGDYVLVKVKKGIVLADSFSFKSYQCLSDARQAEYDCERKSGKRFDYAYVVKKSELQLAA